MDSNDVKKSTENTITFKILLVFLIALFSKYQSSQMTKYLSYIITKEILYGYQSIRPCIVNTYLLFSFEKPSNQVDFKHMTNDLVSLDHCQ